MPALGRGRQTGRGSDRETGLRGGGGSGIASQNDTGQRYQHRDQGNEGSADEGEGLGQRVRRVDRRPRGEPLGVRVTRTVGFLRGLSRNLAVVGRGKLVAGRAGRGVEGGKPLEG